MPKFNPNMRPLVTIAGTPIPDPSTYNATTSTVVDSARNVQGKMVGSVIRDSMAKIECTWRYLSAEDWSYVLKLFNMSLGGNFFNSVTFYNQDTNDWETRDFYISDKTAGMFLRRDDGTVRGWTDCRIALIEI